MPRPPRAGTRQADVVAAAPGPASWPREPALNVAGGLLLAAIGLVTFVAGKLALGLASVNASVSPIWPPTGIAIAAFLLFGRRVWPAIFLGAFLYNLTTAGTVATSLAIASGNTCEGALAAWLTVRFARGVQAFHSALALLRFAAFAACAAVVSATVGVASLGVAGFLDWSAASAAWLTWWAGDTVGALAVTPLLVVWAQDLRIRVTLREWGEGLFLAGVTAATAWLVFDGHVDTGLPLLLVLLWPALRFGPRATATAAVAINAVAIVATLAGRGPFQQADRNDTLLLLQTFLALVTMLALAVSAIVCERRRAEARTRAAQLQRAAGELAAAQKMNDFKTQFINIASHELRTPLLPIKAQLFLLRERGASMGPAALAQAVRVLERNFDRISGLVADLMDAGRLQADRIPLHPAAVDLSQIAQDAAESFQAAATAGGLTLRQGITRPVALHADGPRIAQVLHNLVSNAVKCTPPGGAIDIEAFPGPVEVVVTVRDTGIGMEPDQLARLFEPFSQVHDGGPPMNHGTGLGLYISQGLVQRHGGRMWCESRGQGQGAAVSFALPRRPPDAQGA